MALRPRFECPPTTACNVVQFQELLQGVHRLQQFLQLDTFQAVVGGHSKRGRSATVAAAMDPRVASAIIMGNEGVYATDQIPWHLSFHHAFFQDRCTVPVYSGPPTKSGYRMTM